MKETNLKEWVDNKESQHAEYGGNIPIYYSKSKSNIYKDRILASFISDAFINGQLEHSNTIIKATNGTTGNSRDSLVFRSSRALTYEALIGFVYALRFKGITITSIANIGVDQDRHMVAVDGFNNSTSDIRISVGDSTREMVGHVLDQYKYREKDGHVCKVIDMVANNNIARLDRIIRKAIKGLGSTIEDEYNIESGATGRVGANLLVSDGAVYVNQFDRLVITTTRGKEGNMIDFTDSLANLLDKEYTLMSLRDCGQVYMY